MFGHISKNKKGRIEMSSKLFLLANTSLKKYCWGIFFFFKLGFTPCKSEQPLRGMELQEKKHKKHYRIQKISLERTCS